VELKKVNTKRFKIILNALQAQKTNTTYKRKFKHTSQTVAVQIGFVSHLKKKQLLQLKCTSKSGALRIVAQYNRYKES